MTHRDASRHTRSTADSAPHRCSTVPPRRGIAWCLLLVAGLSGCEAAGQLHVDQPQLPGFQQQMDLLTERPIWSPASGFIRVLAEFPLPGARTGEPVYLLYLRLPESKEPITMAADSSPTGRGFFIQTKGKFAGIARLKGGGVTVEGSGMERESPRLIRLDVTCEDGSRLVGSLRATRDDWHLSEFETRRRPGDVAAMKPVYFQPADSMPAP